MLERPHGSFVHHDQPASSPVGPVANRESFRFVRPTPSRAFVTTAERRHHQPRRPRRQPRRFRCFSDSLVCSFTIAERRYHRPVVQPRRFRFIRRNAPRDRKPPRLIFDVSHLTFAPSPYQSLTKISPAELPPAPLPSPAGAADFLAPPLARLRKPARESP